MMLVTHIFSPFSEKVFDVKDNLHHLNNVLTLILPFATMYS